LKIERKSAVGQNDFKIFDWAFCSARLRGSIAIVIVIIIIIIIIVSLFEIDEFYTNIV
jgi:hypothetical protein